MQPIVPLREYARYIFNAALAQWIASASGSIHNHLSPGGFHLPVGSASELNYNAACPRAVSRCPPQHRLAGRDPGTHTSRSVMHWEPRLDWCGCAVNVNLRSVRPFLGPVGIMPVQNWPAARQSPYKAPASSKTNSRGIRLLAKDPPMYRNPSVTSGTTLKPRSPK